MVISRVSQHCDYKNNHVFNVIVRSIASWQSGRNNAILRLLQKSRLTSVSLRTNSAIAQRAVISTCGGLR